MSDEALTTPESPPHVRKFWVNVTVGVLLAVYAVMALAASMHKGSAFDEPKTMAVGYDEWLRGDFRMDGAHGDFIKRWATLPLLISKPDNVSTNNPALRQLLPYQFGYEFFFMSDNSPDLLLLQGRVMVVLLGLVLGLLIYRCARDVAGVAGGVSALFIFAFSPNMLAYGAMVTGEIPLCLGLLGATWSIWRLLHRVTIWRLLASLGFFALLTLTKPAALMILPVTLGLVLVKFLSERPLDWRIGRAKLINSRVKQIGIFAGLALLHAVVGWGAIWANYDFRYTANPMPATAQSAIPSATSPHDTEDEAVAEFLTWSARSHFLPEGFINGVQVLLGETDTRETFLDGDWNRNGWPTFFLSVAWEKTSPALMLIFVIGLSSWAWSLVRGVRARLRPALGPEPTGAINTYEAAPYLTLLLVFFAMLLSDSLNYGHRSALSVSPALFVLGGCGAAAVWQHRTRWFRALVVVLFLLRAEQALAIYPDFLAYFNPLVDSPDQGYQHLVDRSLDWGMDLPRLKAYLEKHNPGDKLPVFLAYFGTDDPEYYDIVCYRLPGYPDWTPRERFAFSPGIYVISATLFQTLYTSTFGPWNKQYEDEYLQTDKLMQQLEHTANDPKARAALFAAHPPSYWANIYSKYEKLRLARLCSWLRHHETPDTSAGYSMLIWNLDGSELNAALNSAPSELDDAPI